MTPTTAFLGHQSVLGVFQEATYGTGAITSLTNAFIFQSETLKKSGRIVERDGLRGTRSHIVDDTNNGPYSVSGQITFQPNPTDLLFWFPLILGGTFSGGVCPMLETVPSFSVGITRGGTAAVPLSQFLYTGCKVNRATFSGSSGADLRMTLDIIGQAELVRGTAFAPGLALQTWPSISAAITPPYIFQQLALTINSIAREVRDFELVIDNGLIPDRFMNSTTIVNLPEGDRRVSLRNTFAFATANADMYDIGNTPFTGPTLSMTNGTNTTTFTFGALVAPTDSPTAASRGENFLSMNWLALKHSTTMELSVASN